MAYPNFLTDKERLIELASILTPSQVEVVFDNSKTLFGDLTNKELLLWFKEKLLTDEQLDHKFSDGLTMRFYE